MPRPKRDTLMAGKGRLVRVEHRPIATPPRRPKPAPVTHREMPRLPAPSVAGTVHRLLAGGPIRFPKELM